MARQPLRWAILGRHPVTGQRGQAHGPERQGGWQARSRGRHRKSALTVWRGSENSLKLLTQPKEKAPSSCLGGLQGRNFPSFKGGHPQII